MICWYCYYGWSEQVLEIYNKYILIAGESAMHFGAAHIVWEDENFERKHVQWCLDHFKEYKREDSTEEENKAVKQSLIELLALPDEILSPEPLDYDNVNQQNYPPKIKMSKNKL